MNPVGLIFVVIGAFTILGSVKNWDIIFNSRKAWLIVKIFGRQGARIFYGLLGIFLTVVGLLMTFGYLS